jgi:hypothetical protein
LIENYQYDSLYLSINIKPSGIPLLPGGIPRNSQGQIDVVNLIGESMAINLVTNNLNPCSLGTITRRVSNGTTLADVLPPEQLQTLADNVTDALLPGRNKKEI